MKGEGGERQGSKGRKERYLGRNKKRRREFDRVQELL